MDLRVIGMMSGTSYDAVDAAVADLSLDGDVLNLVPLGTVSVDMPIDLHSRIAGILPPAATTIDEVTRLHTELGQLFGAVAARARDEIGGGTVDLVSSHGQTVYHWVSDGHALGDLQLGSPAFIAAAAGCSVVSDLRNADIAAGGHGAPLVSMLDELLVLRGDRHRGSLNLGGIANITVVGETGVLAYDLGPANALIDAAVSRQTHGTEAFDTDGRRAARGTVDTELLKALLSEPYYTAPLPKSTGKELFHADYLAQFERASGVDGDDLIATLTELTARLVADACSRHGLRELVVAGGGVRNPVLLQRIQRLCTSVTVRPMDDYGLPAQAKEAYAFAMLGYLAVHGLPGTLAGATGAPVGSVLGSMTPGPAGPPRPESGLAAPTRLVVGAP
jgi:anhydro-N-acetylmuramic acid kinase